MLLIVGTITAQVEIKGFTLGAILENNSKTIGNDEHPNVRMLKTTLGGVEGVLMFFRLNNKTIHTIAFTPENSSKAERISDTEVTNIKKGLESKLNIKFEFRKDDYGIKIYRAIKDGVTYYIYTDYNKYMTPSTEFKLLIFNNKLKDKNDKEEQERANLDF